MSIYCRYKLLLRHDIVDSIPSRDKRFSSSCRHRDLLLWEWGGRGGALFVAVKWLGHSSPSGAEIRNERSYAFTPPHALMACAGTTLSELSVHTS